MNIIENSMVPGKYIGLGNIVIQKLQNQLGILSRGREEVKSSLKKFKKSSVNSETKKNSKWKWRTLGRRITLLAWCLATLGSGLREE